MEELLKQKNLMIKTVFFSGLQFAALLSCLSVTWAASASFLPGETIEQWIWFDKDSMIAAGLILYLLSLVSTKN